MTHKIIKVPKFFYIIEFDGQIHEVRFSQEGYAKTFELWQKKGLIIFKDFKGVAGANVKKVLLEDDYRSFIEMTSPKTYIRNGIIKDGKNHEVIRMLDWKKKEVDAKKLLETPKYKILSEEERDLARKKIEEIKKELNK